MQTRPPGIYSIPAAEYHADTWALSASMLKDFASDSLMFACRYIDKTEPKKESSKAMKMGTLIHAMALEPDTIGEVACVVPTDYITRSGARSSAAEAVAWDKEQEANGIISFMPQEWVYATKAAKAVTERLTAEGFPPSVCKAEQSIYWDEDGLMCRARLDIMPARNAIVDVKAMASAHPLFVANQVKRLLHWIQQSHYSLGFERHFGEAPGVFAFLVVEPMPPFNTSVDILTAKYRQEAIHHTSLKMQRYRECLSSGDWRNLWSIKHQPLDSKPWTFESVIEVEE